jgi:hypothetical protein
MSEESTTADLVEVVTNEWVDGMVARVIGRAGPDEARAAAERLAEERG